jgi:hypothetical protein
LQQQRIARITRSHPLQETLRDKQREEFDRPSGADAQCIGQAQSVDQHVGVANRVGQLLLPR